MLTNTKHTNAGSYTDSWLFSNDNYLNDSGSVTDKIGKAQPSVTIDWSGSTYSGTANPASASVSGVGSPACQSRPCRQPHVLQRRQHRWAPQLTGAPKDAGTYTVKADYNGSDNYKTATNTKTITIAKAYQQITFNRIRCLDPAYGSPDFQVSATTNALDNLTVSFAASGSCTISGTTVTLVSLGTCTMTASRADERRLPDVGDPADACRHVERARNWRRRVIVAVPHPGKR